MNWIFFGALTFLCGLIINPLGNVVGSECSGITDPQACVDHVKVVHTCVYCPVSGRCNDVGSIYDICSNDCCASDSDLSTCKNKNISSIPKTCYDNPPQQIRTSFIPGGLSISFTTQARLRQAPLISYGLSANNLSFTAKGQDHDYGTSWFNDVLLQNLLEGQNYFYQILSDGVNLPSSIIQITSPIKTGSTSEFSLILVGDMGLANSGDTISSLKDHVMNKKDIAFILHAGDLSYADDYYLRAGDNYEGSWDKWQSAMQDITMRVPYMVLPGNHEITCNEVTPFICPDGQKNMTAYKNRFRMPGPESGGTGNLWFSYDFGMAHFIHLNFETDFPNSPSGPGSYLNGGGEAGQLEWLEMDLIKASQNRNNVPWIIAAGHRPFYTSGRTCEPCKVFQDYFNKYAVDIYFSGHVHWYERLYAIGSNGTVENKNYFNPNAPIYIVNGAAGNIEGHEANSPYLNYTAFINTQDYGFGILTFHNRSALTWEYRKSQDDSLVDSISIHKEH